MRIAQGVAAMIRWVASTPSMSAITTSMSRSSGASRAQGSNGLGAVAHGHITACSGRGLSTRRRASSARGESCTMPIFTAAPARSGR